MGRRGSTRDGELSTAACARVAGSCATTSAYAFRWTPCGRFSPASRRRAARQTWSPRDDVRITEPAPVLRATAAGGRDLVQLRWSWPGPGGKPVYNFRSDRRRFPNGRCLIPADGFYEFTDPEPPAPKRARKTKWLFTMSGEP